jgi:alpha-L-rhamnosidase
MFKHTGLACALLAAFLLLMAKAQAASPTNAWTAEWITALGAAERDEVVLHFRKQLNLREAPEHFLVDVSADNQFLLYVNQQRVGSGPNRSDPAHWRYETYDLAPFLHAGKNILAATVWNFGTHAAIAQMTERVGFLVHGEGVAEQSADTNQTWGVEQEKAIRSLQPRIEGYYAAEPGERLDGASFDWAWDRDSSSSPAWSKAVSISQASKRGDTDAHNNWQLVPDQLPSAEFRAISAGKIVRMSGIGGPTGFPEKQLDIPAHASVSVLLDHSELNTAFPALRVRGGAGALVRLTYAEALVDDKGEKGNRNQIQGKHIEGVSDEFLPGGCDDCEFMPLAWRTWRFLELRVETADQPLQLEKLQAWFTAFPFAERAQFQSEDQWLGQIWDVGWRTARLDAHDTYMDTPYWERLQYIGDTRIQALISYTVAGDDRLARQAIQGFNDSRIPDGLTQSRYPSSLVQMIPTFSLLWIGMVHDFWMYRADPDFVRAQVPGTRTVLDWFIKRQRPDGLLGKIPWWPFLDWSKDFTFGMPPQDENGGSSALTLQFIEALRYAAELEKAYGDPTLADNYAARANRAAQAVWKLCWNQQYGLLADTSAQRHFSQHANILGVWLDVVPRNFAGNVMSRILSSTDAGFFAQGPVPAMTSATYYFRFYLARALEHAGMGDEYLHLLGPWKNMLSLGLSTWAESPEPTRSDSHAWSAHPNYDLLTIVGGIHPNSPGFKSVLIEPHLGDLRQVSAAMPTSQGRVEVEFKRTVSGVKATINLPPGVSGELVWKGQTHELQESSSTHEIQLP